MKAWYGAPAINHYRCIKAMIESGAIWVTDMFKFHHHSLPFPTVSNADCIIKAVQDLKCAIDSKPTAPHDGLQAIEALHALILGCNNTNCNVTSDYETGPETESNSEDLNVNIDDESSIIPLHTLTTTTAKMTWSSSPTTIAFNPHELCHQGEAHTISNHGNSTFFTIVPENSFITAR